ncbi:MAG: ATP-binding protein [Desulfobacteraceae bacterium]|nr:ATP-binding protein [Desulfobacteraceae bacterium]
MSDHDAPFADSTVQNLVQAQHLLANISLIIKLLNDKEAKLADSLAEILDLLLDYIGVEQGSIMVQENKELVVAAATRPELIGKRQPLTGASVAAWVARTGKPIFIPDISQDDRFQARNGVYKKNAVLSAPIIQNGKLLGVINATDKGGDKDLLKEDVAYLLDFSSLIIAILVQRQMQRELQRQRNILKKRNQELRRQEALRDELYRMLIHDLKAPLAEVVANLDILSYSIGGGEQREFMEAAQMGCERTVSMISNLIATSKIEDGKLKLSLESTAVPGLIHEALSAISGLARSKGIELRLTLDPELPPIHMDRVLILRTLQNLLTNALGHSPGGRVITAGSRLLPTGSQIEFSVSDQGAGIPEHQRQGLFEKYSRLSDRQDALVGTGLGLYFCKLAVELHRGTIGVDTPPEGRGSRFHFTLPLR